MQALKTQINPQSDEFRGNAAAMRTLVDDLRAKAAATALGGDEASRAKHTARGKLLPRDRVAQLLDPGTPFLEIGQLAAHGMYDGDAPAAGLIAGVGPIAFAVLLAGCGDETPTRPAVKAGGETVTVDQPTYDVAVPGVTPMPERVAVLGFLNKRNGIVRNISLKPGQAVRIKDAIVRLRACEKSAP